MTVVPSPGRLSISMEPPCSMTTLRAMARPRPVPLPGSLVVKKGSKTCSRWAGLMPQPLSLTVKPTVPGERRQRRRISPPAGTASSALLKRVSSRVSSRLRSAKTSCPRPSEVSTVRLALAREDGGLEEAGDGFDHGGEILRRLLHRHGAGEIEQALHEVAAELEALFDARQIGIEGGAGGVLADQLGADEQRGERGIQVMRSAGGHLPHAGELFDLDHLAAPAHALADVAGDFEKTQRAGPFAKRQQAELNLEGLAVSGLAQGFDIEHGDAVLHAAEEVLEFGGFRGGENGEARAQDFVASVAVHAFGGSVPFEDAQFGIIEDDGAGKGFQQSTVEVARAAQVGLAFSALAKHKPGGPEGQQQRRGDTARDVEVMQRDVVGIAEESVFDQFPSRQNHRDDSDAGERQGRPEPPFFRHRADDGAGAFA